MRAEQAWVRQSRRPILEMQSLNAVLMSGIERHGCGGRDERGWRLPGRGTGVAGSTGPAASLPRTPASYWPQRVGGPD